MSNSRGLFRLTGPPSPRAPDSPSEYKRGPGTHIATRLSVLYATYYCSTLILRYKLIYVLLKLREEARDLHFLIRFIGNWDHHHILTKDLIQ
jgi:hypothetical protein